jgi:multiple sugar transport system substrate-binding protein
MKKKMVSGLLAATMVAGLLFGCGGGDTTEAPAASDDTTTEAASSEDGGDDAAEVAEDTGKVLNIYCWNEEFKTRITDHYPGYEEVDATTGKIGDVEVKWNITPSDDNAYQNNLDETLLKQADAADDDKIDMFLLEADYALKYVDSDYTMPVADLGITDEDLSKQYQYTKDIVTDSNGNLKGVSWQGCPGVLFYNRDAAAEVLGTEDPAEVQEYVKDWATFNETATRLKEAGYKITATVNDSYRVYSNNVTTKWVSDDNKVQIDDNIKAWVDDSKALVDAGETTTAELWSDDWSKGFYPDGKVFCYFGPAWLVNFSMAADTEGSIGYNGRWGATEGPQGFYWGGTWCAAATGTDNANLVKDIMLKMTTDDTIMKEIIEADDDFVNNQDVIAEMASSDYSSKILGGQNPLGIYSAGVETLDLSNISAYDQGCNEEFQGAMKNYFDGNATYDEALQQFYTAIKEKYPELTTD